MTNSEFVKVIFVLDDGCVDKSDSPPPTASYDHLPLDVWPACHQAISGEAGGFDPVAGADGDGAGDGGDIKGGNWWDPCTFYYHHGHLGESHFSHGKMLHLFHICSQFISTTGALPIGSPGDFRLSIHPSTYIF